MEKEKKGVRLDHISKIYKDPKTGKDFYAVKDTCLEIQPGSFVTLLGPSGCGKTTTLRMIAGFESPDEGEIYLGNEAINALPPNKRDTAMVFQSYALLPHYNVFDNVAYGLKLRKVPKDEIRPWILTSCFIHWGFMSTDISCPTSFPAVSSSVSPWHGRWYWSRACCCLTSRCPIWTQSSG